ncbi:MAG: hypothetical protein QOF58_8813, partial [Pseudonocardiales bacterium]|nr:hypothetical protein [Pseudonocardiales bacterium]
MRPAWSWQFDRPTVRDVTLPITRDWAWGGSSGDDVKVA